MDLNTEQRKRLPEWASFNDDDGRIEIDPDIVYPIFIEKTGLEADQYGAEVARRCATEELRRAVGIWCVKHADNPDPDMHPKVKSGLWFEEAMAAVASRPGAPLYAAMENCINLRILSREDWRLSNLPEGMGAMAGSEKFRRHYNQIDIGLN